MQRSKVIKSAIQQSVLLAAPSGYAVLTYNQACATSIALRYLSSSSNDWTIGVLCNFCNLFKCHLMLCWKIPNLQDIIFSHRKTDRHMIVKRFSSRISKLQAPASPQQYIVQHRTANGHQIGGTLWRVM